MTDAKPKRDAHWQAVAAFKLAREIERQAMETGEVVCGTPSHVRRIIPASMSSMASGVRTQNGNLKFADNPADKTTVVPVSLSR